MKADGHIAAHYSHPDRMAGWFNRKLFCGCAARHAQIQRAGLPEL
jgi:hypothetical protein